MLIEGKIRGGCGAVKKQVSNLRPIIPPSMKKYTNGLYEDEPCICIEKCDNKGPCKGKCGCEACNMAYNDFLGMPEC